MINRCCFVVCAVAVIALPLLPSIVVADAEATGAICILNTTDCDDCRTRLVDDATCTPPGGPAIARCQLMLCTGGGTNFNGCQQLPSAMQPCNIVAGQIDEECTGCAVWNCGCATPAGGCNFQSCSGCNTGGTQVGKKKITQGCAS